MYPGTFENLKQWSANRGQNSGQTVQSGSGFSRFRSNCIPIISVSVWFCRRNVNKKYKTTADFVVLVEVLAFTLWKLVTSLHSLFWWEVTFEAKYLFGKSLQSCVSMWPILVRLLRKTLKVCYDYVVCMEVLAFRQFLQVLLFVYVRESRGHARLGLKLLPAY